MALFYVCAVVLGIWAAFFVIGYAMVNIHCPFDRVAFYLTLLASEFTAVLLAYLLLNFLAFSVLATFALTKCLLWCILDHRKMVHMQITLEK